MKALAIVAALILGGCATRTTPTPSLQPMASVDIYLMDNGFFVITERGSGNSIAYKFNIEAVHPTSPEPTEQP